jgi:hypothetical protein
MRALFKVVLPLFLLAAAVKGGVSVSLELGPWATKFIVVGTAAPKP